jgi:hypothetical protein
MVPQRRTLGFLDDVIFGLATYYLTTLLVVLGVIFGHDFVKPPPHQLDSVGPNPDLLTCFARYDGQHYRKILEDGYEYYPDRQSSIAFFPAYPLTARFVSVVTGCSSDVALLIVSHVFLAAAFVAFTSYVRQRFGNFDEQAQFAVLAFGLFPTTFFFRMAYSESTFVFLAILALLGMERRWPVILIALIIGAATATRATGVALVPAFAYHLWRRSKTRPPDPGEARPIAPSPLAREGRGEGTVVFRQLPWALPLSCWGLLAFTAYQWSAFDEPLAWAKGHAHWRLFPDLGFAHKLQSLVTLEPVWSMLLPDSPRYWGKWEWHDNPFFSLVLANPILFLFTGALIVTGAAKRWLTGPEIILGIGLLLIPYGGRGYENLMLSTGRFCAVAFPVYIVLGKVLGRMPNHVGILLLTISSFLLNVYSGLFAKGYQLF